jgi:hypothetical protein
VASSLGSIGEDRFGTQLKGEQKMDTDIDTSDWRMNLKTDYVHDEYMDIPLSSRLRERFGFLVWTNRDTKETSYYPIKNIRGITVWNQAENEIGGAE